MGQRHLFTNQRTAGQTVRVQASETEGPTANGRYTNTGREEQLTVTQQRSDTTRLMGSKIQFDRGNGDYFTVAIGGNN